MKQKDKELLLKVLCDGLPHGVIVQYKGHNTIIKDKLLTGSDLDCNMEYYKPYLRDMEDMTEHEQAEFSYFTCVEDNRYITTSLFEDATDWLNKKHFNWRGLPEDRYIRVTEENNPY